MRVSKCVTITVATLLAIQSVSFANPTPSFEETLEHFVHVEACGIQDHSVYLTESQKQAQLAERKLHAEILGGRIARLSFENYMITMESLGSRYAANSDCWEGLADLFQEIQSKLPEPNPLTREERYAVQREETIAKWAGLVLFGATVFKSFSGAPKTDPNTPKNVWLGMKMAGEKVATTSASMIARMERLVAYIKNSPALESEFQMAQRSGLTYGPHISFERLAMRRTLDRTAEAMRRILEIAKAILLTKPDFQMRRRTAEFLDKIMRSFDPIEQALIPLPGQSRFQPLLAFSRSKFPAVKNLLLDLGTATAVASAGFVGYRGLGYGEIAAEKPQPSELLAVIQADLILDLENRVLALEGAVDLVEKLPENAATQKQINDLRSGFGKLLIEWMHFRDRAPRFNHTVVLHSDSAITLADSYELLGRIGNRLSKLP